jgi:thymidylate synthase
MKIHEHENNPESQDNLDKNKKHFSKQCKKVLELLLQGKRLTVKSAISNYDIWSLPRRILDLRENGVNICDEWVEDKHGESKIKQYFLAPKSDEEKRELQSFFSQYQNEQPPTQKPKWTEQELFTTK